MVAETQEPASTAGGAIVPVGEVTSSSTRLPAADLEGIKKLATQTREIGIILPPPDIRAIVDKTAQFVARNGAEFEKRILANEANNVKFNFLNPTDPYHAFYRMRVQNFIDADKAGVEVADVVAKPAAAAAAAAAPAIKAAAPAAAPVATTRPLEKPADEKYTVHVPEGLTALDVDIVKLTAQFVARNGKAFLTGLAQREAANPQFFFLKPTHSMFSFFTALADAYSAVLMPDKELRARLEADSNDRGAILERCLKRLEWEGAREREAREAADEAEKEREAMAQIDWHDFVVVETIEFYDDEDAELPPPLTLKDVLRMNKDRDFEGAQEAEASAAAGAAAAATAAAGANGQANGGPQPPSQPPPMAMDAEEAALVAMGQQAGTAPPSAAPPGEAAAAAAAGAGDDDHDMDVDMEEDEQEEAPMRVVKNYKRPDPRQANAAYDPTKFVVSPITGELVAIAEMAEHMRISLIDPRWRDQRESMLSKIRDTTRAGDDEITQNLVRLAGVRPDIFGSTEEEITSLVSAAVEEKMTSGTNRPVSWDGVTQGGQDLRNQLKAIQDQRNEASGGGSSYQQQMQQQQQQQQQRLTPQAPPPALRPPPPAPGGAAYGQPPARQPLAPPMRPPQPPGGFAPPPMQQPRPPMAAPPVSRPLPPPPALQPPSSTGPPAAATGTAAAAAGSQPAPASSSAFPPPPASSLPPPPAAAGAAGSAPPPSSLPPPPALPAGPPTGGPGALPPPPGSTVPPPPTPMGAPPAMGQALPPMGGGLGVSRPAPPLPLPDPKRQRLEFVLEPEDDFLQKIPGPSEVNVQCPKVDGNDKLNGQILKVAVASLRDTIQHFKDRLVDVTGVPANKQQLNREHVGFLKNELSLAHYNVGPDVVLTLGTKERGGRKK